MQQLHGLAEAQMLALAIVDTLQEPFLVLDDQFRVLAGSRRFFEVFNEDATKAHGRSLFDLADGQWDIPALRELLATIVPQDTLTEDFEIAQTFKDIGARTMLLNARRLVYDGGASRMILLAIQDITSRRVIEQDKQRLLEDTEKLLAQQETLLREMRHRIANSLQIIASILLLKANSVTSEETRQELHDAHQRVMSVAAVQRHLHAAEGIEQIDMNAYLSNLTAGLAASMLGPNQAIEIVAAVDDGTLPTSHAVSLGLIATELVINAIKYAFPKGHAAARVCVSFETAGTDWRLAVSDNGVGRTPGRSNGAGAGTGLGTAIVTALAKQLDAQVAESSSSHGLTVEIYRATFASRLPRAA
jgi:two-component sensor histidine kinase